MADVKEVAFKAAKRAGAIQKEGVSKAKNIDYKSAFNLVTDVDKECERQVMGIIKEHFPEDELLGEESGAHTGSSRRRWIIDPLDGTTNFAHGYPYFSVSIGLEHDGEIVLGVVYNAISDELFWAEKGKGAYLNDKRISVSSIDKVANSLLATGFPSDTSNSRHPNTSEFAKITGLSHGVRRDGSAALDLSFVACGRFECFWELNLAPWDIAAGSLIIVEAGGKVTNVAGGKLDCYGKHILATNGKIHAEVMELLGYDKPGRLPGTNPADATVDSARK